MGIYKNDFKKEQDECLWEIHEIRHGLDIDIRNQTTHEITENAKKIFEKWKKELLVER